MTTVASQQRSSSKDSGPRRPPATTPDARERQLIGKAVDLAEKQLEQGTASSQVITHFLKMGSTREHLEQDLLSETIALKKAQRENMASAARVEELYGAAIDAMRAYSGQVPLSEGDDYDD